MPPYCLTVHLICFKYCTVYKKASDHTTNLWKWKRQRSCLKNFDNTTIWARYRHDFVQVSPIQSFRLVFVCASVWERMPSCRILSKHLHHLCLIRAHTLTEQATQTHFRQVSVLFRSFIIWSIYVALLKWEYDLQNAIQKGIMLLPVN